MTLTKDKLRVLDAPEAAAAHFRTVTVDDLVVSPLNVRSNEEDANAVEALADNIAARGLMFPLLVHDLAVLERTEHAEFAKAHEGELGVLAGGRRLRAIAKLVREKRLPRDYPIMVIVRDCDPATITELSLAENLLRRELRPYEIHAAIALAVERGDTVDQIAANCGQKTAWVRQQLRLGTLDPAIFASYVAGKLSIDQARAYGATEDHALQRAAFDHFAKLPAYEGHANAVRRWLKVGDQELARLLLFVGEGVYRGNGGRFELDLFADGPDQHRGRVTDEAKLRELAAEKREVVLEQVRKAWKLPALRFEAVPPKDRSGYIDRALEIEPGRSAWEKRKPPRGADVADLFATIEVEQDGGWSPRLWWATRKAKAAFDRKDPPRNGEGDHPLDSGGAAAGEAYEAVHGPLVDGRALNHTDYAAEREGLRIARDEHGLAADGVNVVRTIRRDILRALLLTADEALAGDVPRDFLTWSSLRQQLAHDRSHRTGARGLVGEGYSQAEREPSDLMKDQRDGQEAEAIWSDALELLRGHPAFAEEADAAEALRAYLAETPGLKRLAEAVLTGLALVRSASSPGWDIPAQHVLAEALGGTPEHVRRFWKPTAAFTGLFGKLARQGMVQPFVDEAERRGLAKAKDRDLTARTAEILAAQPDWLHPLLAFAAPEIETSGFADVVEDAREPEPVQ